MPIELSTSAPPSPRSLAAASLNVKPLFNESLLAAHWEGDYRKHLASGEDRRILDILQAWANRQVLNEVASQAAFMQHFFQDILGYLPQGNRKQPGYHMHPGFPIARAGQTGGKGQADLALGNFGDGGDGIPQILCEFKDIRSGLDAPQPRYGNNRSPVTQALDYLRESRTGVSGHEAVMPTWAIVTDMNEFRLYRWDEGPTQSQRFVIAPGPDARNASLLDPDPGGAFRRFLFVRLFHRESLLSERGPSPLARLLANQVIHEQGLEKNFYLEYRAFREFVFQTLVEANPAFPGTKGKLVRLTQRLLDRCLFIIFCEDMGIALQFPPNLLRDMLMDYSMDRYYNAEDSLPWDRLKTIFRTMRDGGLFGAHTIAKFNGGLFEACPDLENLAIPAKVFCARQQGQNTDSLTAHPRTLLYFAAKYNFGIKNAAHEPMIDLYALGRIFEQSITELEIMEAEADGRPSLNLLSKRKRDGVYYTPEWVTAYIVDQVVGGRLDDLKADVGLTPDHCPGDDDIARFRRSPLRGKKAAAWLAALRHYRIRLQSLRIVDPACGSGAFLIQALERLKKEHDYIAREHERIVIAREFADRDEIVRMILAHNLYGVDINAESVEITRLALWMHTATPGKPLSGLDHNIQCGNSLVGPDFAEFYRHKHNTLFTQADEAERERINAFDWRTAFPEVFAQGGFDCVIGNPPYVKLQNFRRVQSDAAEYLTEARRPDGSPLYTSTQSGNFDLYLPFIEKGLDLLNPEGRMGYIAPNVWLVNEYGQSLRAKLKQNRQIDRWVDFKSYQVFEEAITYTALQFFRSSPCEAVRCAFPSATRGQIGIDVASISWAKPEAVIPYTELPDTGAWNLLPDAERRLIVRLNRECSSLGSEAWTHQIFQGLITSADAIYHLERRGPGRYLTQSGEEVALEDSLMRPLISGPEAKRYQAPKTSTYLLFPYCLDKNRTRLFTAQEMAARYPSGWAYLKKHEAELRVREHASFNDTEWYRFGRNQNIDKQELPKLYVAQTVPNMRVSFDATGEYFLNNVRVNGILTDSIDTGWYILGVLNSPLVDFVFRRTAKPKDGGWFEANKQFIAPLPIPGATEEEKKAVGERAKQLQALHTSRRELMDKFDRRLESGQTVEAQRASNWLWADIRTPAEWKQQLQKPAELKGRALTEWAREQVESRLQAQLAQLSARLHAGAILAVEHGSDELRLLVDGQRAIELFDQPDTPLIAAQWRQKLRTTTITEAFDGKRLVNLLLDLRATEDQALAAALVKLDTDIQALDAEIATVEADINALIYRLYRLTPEEIAMVEAAR